MDYADDDAVTRYERWEKALESLYWSGGSQADQNLAISKAAGSLFDGSSITAMKREAVINAARIEGDEHLARVGRAFPGLDLAALVQALRVRYVEMRMAGEL